MWEQHRSSRGELFLRKSVLKICPKFTGEHPCRSVISINLLCSFIEVTLWHGRSFALYFDALGYLDH